MNRVHFSADVQRKIERFAKNETAPILLLGETGTGKELTACAIHDAGGKGKLVVIDCGSLVGTLVESELFGHVRGAFTDAKTAKQGLIEQANGGTALFDEIGVLPMDMQTRLLRVIEQREYRPVGSSVWVPIAMRVIAATWVDLALAVLKGTFRQDLFYRLNVLTLHLLPLRERREEIPGLIEFFLNKFSPFMDLSFCSDAMLMLRQYDWPGNIRELANVVQSVVAMSDGPVYLLSDLPKEIQYPAPREGVIETSTLAEAEVAHIIQALARHHGARGETAKALGIDRTTLQRRLKMIQEESASGMGKPITRTVAEIETMVALFERAGENLDFAEGARFMLNWLTSSDKDK